jgi:uncharacterized damage-inducible protein DinB
MSDLAFTVARLRATPFLLRALTRDCPPARAWTPPAAGEWSIAEVVRHLVDGERGAFLPRLRRMVAEDRPVFQSGRGSAGDDADLDTLLAAFEAARRQSAGVLGSLDDTGWRREGVSPSRGPLTIAEYARTMADHDTEHLRQIHAVREHLGLLPRRCEARMELPLGEIVAAIRDTPARLESVALGLTPDELRHRPREGEWSMKEVMAHLLKVERDVFLPRLRRTLEEERPVFDSFDPDAWAAERDHRAGRFEDDLSAFTAVRRHTVVFLEGLPAGAGERVAVSAYFGPVTLAQYATHVVDHDLEHLTQLTACRAAARRG